MTPENGDRPDVPNIVIVITDGRSQDDVYKPADALRKRGAIVSMRAERIGCYHISLKFSVSVSSQY